MTVIRGKHINYPSPSSVVVSDAETLSLDGVSESDVESLSNEHLSTNCRLLRKPPSTSYVEELKVKKNPGRKKLRRYLNRCILQTLDEEDETDYVVIMESYKGPFTRLLDDKVAMEYWNAFIEKSEEEQAKIVNASSDKYCNHLLPECSNKPDSPGRISSRIRRTFKIRKNLSLETVQDWEKDLIAFFRAHPERVYIKFPPSSFERLLIHGLAQYHKLKSMSTFVDEETRRSVVVQNTMNDWTPANSYLSDFIEHLRK